jgi:acetyltransferase-like isoleucine patch superfamily enzyme
VWQFASVIRGGVVGADCNIGSGATIDSARLGDRVSIGHGAFICPGIFIEDDVFIGPGVIFCNDAWPSTDKTGFDLDALISGSIVTTRVRAGASIGAGAIVLPGVDIGEYAMIAAGSTVAKSVEANHLHKRNGEICPIDPTRPIQRMRPC